MSLRASLAANTSIKLAGSLSTSDARDIAPHLRTTSDFIVTQLSLACHIRKVTQTAISLPVDYGTPEGQPTMPDEAYEEMLHRNRERVASGPEDEDEGVLSGNDVSLDICELADDAEGSQGDGTEPRPW